ncbi:MAG: hypothetical protein CVU12_02210 [Bacteroidetes bacterium HGW-Bacteroidetes-7]|jgi:hypothetical protein|nr:MAG: hypothetical protein CVU12_02210 [Bacteroidetes bacterium HGW-Bacteroidetes-7]
MKKGTILWISVIAAIGVFLALPATREIFTAATNKHPYIMGFIKFAILATMGEFLAARLIFKRWVMIKGLLPKMVIWGVLGVLIVLMFSLYTSGVNGAVEKGLLFTGQGYLAKILIALYISIIMNLTFAPAFMASHRITDVYIDKIYSGEKSTLSKVISEIDWGGFLKFVVGKTIPLFWIPAHTITFLLPDEFKVIFAASLSIILGLILSFARHRK